MTATHIVNRTPSIVLDWKTPFEKLYQEPPDLSYFKVFGCLAYATNTKPHKTKFESRAIPSVFIGYAQNQKAYKLYDIHTK